MNNRYSQSNKINTQSFRVRNNYDYSVVNKPDNNQNGDVTSALDQLTKLLNISSNCQLQNNCQHNNYSQNHQATQPQYIMNDIKGLARDIVELASFNEGLSQFDQKYNKENRNENTVRRLMESENKRNEKIMSLKFKQYQEEKEKLSSVQLINPVSKKILEKKKYVPLQLRTDEVLAQQKDNLYKIKNKVQQEQEAKQQLEQLQLYSNKKLQSSKKLIPQQNQQQNSQRKNHEFLKNMQEWLQKKQQHIKQEQFSALIKQMDGITFMPSINKSSKQMCQNKYGKEIQFNQRTQQMQEEKKERLKKLEEKVKNQYNYKPLINQKSRKIANQIPKNQGFIIKRSITPQLLGRDLHRQSSNILIQRYYSPQKMQSNNSLLGTLHYNNEQGYTNQKSARMIELDQEKENQGFSQITLNFTQRDSSSKLNNTYNHKLNKSCNIRNDDQVLCSKGNLQENNEISFSPSPNNCCFTQNHLKKNLSFDKIQKHGNLIVDQFRGMNEVKENFNKYLNCSVPINWNQNNKAKTSSIAKINLNSNSTIENYNDNSFNNDSQYRKSTIQVGRDISNYSFENLNRSNIHQINKESSTLNVNRIQSQVQLNEQTSSSRQKLSNRNQKQDQFDDQKKTKFENQVIYHPNLDYILGLLKKQNIANIEQQ